MIQDKMGTIVRLQGLDTKASTEDIRSFFEGVHIPDGGVFIVGGTIGEAFIAFNSEEDGLLAVQRSGDFLKDFKVDLHMSNMVEFEHKLATMLKKKRLSSKHCTNKKTLSSSNGKKMPVEVKPVDPSINNRPPSTTKQPVEGPAEQSLDIDSLDSKTAFLLGVCSLLQGLESSQTKMDTLQFPVTSTSEPKQNPGYSRVFGLPLSTNKNDICQFFKGLQVQEVIVNVDLGVSRGCLVKFSSLQDAQDALRFNQYSMGSACVEVRAATEKMWISALQECEDVCHEGLKLKHRPLKDTVNYKQREGSRKRQRKNSPHKSPKKLKTKCQTTTAVLENMQHIVMVSHLPVQITKSEIKELFGCPNIAHTNILHLLDTNSHRTDKAFILFNSLDDYDYALNLSGCHVGSHTIEVSSITQEEMKTMIRTKAKPVGPKQKTQIKKSNQKRKSDTNQDIPSVKLDTTPRTCLYLRNMPGNVRRSQIKALFSDNKLNDNDITLLYDSDGCCIGEAVVQFHSQTNAAVALIHHGKDFLGSKVLLTPICVKQMEDILNCHF